MIFQQLTVCNYGPFKGVHEIDLKPDNNAPIILFGALNGSGKTTLFDSIQLALFGKYIKASGKFTGGYEKYLRSLMNRDSLTENNTYIILSMKVDLADKAQNITVKREWMYDQRIREKCSVYINDKFDESLSKRAYEFIQSLISPELSNLFFFDGEKIESLADPDKSKHIISQGINDLLGVNSIDNLIKTLSIVERRKASKLAQKQEEVSIIEEQQKIELIERNIKSVYEKINVTENNISQKESEILEHNKLMTSSGAQLFKKRDGYKNALNLNSQKCRGIEERVHDYLAGDLPLLLVSDFIEDIREVQANSKSYTPEIAEVIKKEINNFVTSQNISFQNQSSDKVVEDYFKNIDKSINKYPFLSNNPIVPDESFINNLKLVVKDLMEKIEKAQNEKNEIERNLAAIPENSKVSDLIIKENRLESELIEMKVKLGLLKNELIELEKQLERTSNILDQKIEVISENESINQLDRNIILTSKKSRETLESFKRKLILKHIDAINKQITTCFCKIIRKDNKKINFQINIDDFSIIMLDGERESTISMMSSGERQILALSILWTLSILADKDMPLLIDTPLARLDSKHRENLLKEYFPHSSHQVLIFSTDEEIDQKYYPMIANVISHNYLIEYDESTSLSSLSKGYFREVIGK